MRRRRLSTARTVICANEECEAPVEVHVYPEEKETREVPGFPATIDTPRICPACGVVIDNDTADRWLTALLEAEPLDDDFDEDREREGDFK